MEDDTDKEIANIYASFNCENETCKHLLENSKEFAKRESEFFQKEESLKKLISEKDDNAYRLVELEKETIRYYQACQAAVNEKETVQSELERVQQELDIYKNRFEEASKRAADSEEHLKSANGWRTDYDQMSQLAEQLEAKLDEAQTRYVKSVSLLDQYQKKFTNLKTKYDAEKAKIDAEKTKYAPIVARLNILEKYLGKAILIIDFYSCKYKLDKEPKPMKDIVYIFRRDDVRVQFNSEPFRRSAVVSSATEVTELGLEMSDDEDESEKDGGGNNDEEDDDADDLSAAVEKLVNPGSSSEKKTREKKERVRRFLPVENLKSWPKGIKKPLPESVKGTAEDFGVFNPRRVHSESIPAPFKRYDNDFEALNRAANQRKKALLDRAAGPSSSSNTLPSFVEPAAATIHGRKGKTVREQQTENMKKMSVKEMAEKMKADEKFKSNTSSTSKSQPPLKKQITPRKSPRTRNSTLSEESMDEIDIPDIQVPTESSDDVQPTVSESVKLRRSRSSSAHSEVAARRRGRPTSRRQESPEERRSQSVVAGETSRMSRSRENSSSAHSEVSASRRRGRPSSRRQESPEERRSQSVVAGETSRMSRSRENSIVSASKKSSPPTLRKSKTTDERQRRTSDRFSKNRLPECVPSEEPSQVLASPRQQRRSQRLVKPTESTKEQRKNQSNEQMHKDDVEKTPVRSRLRSCSNPTPVKKSKYVDAEPSSSATPMLLKKSARLSTAHSREEEQTDPEIPAKMIANEKKRIGAPPKKEAAKVQENDGPPIRVRSMPVRPTSRKKTAEKSVPDVPVRRSSRYKSVDESECDIPEVSNEEVSEVGTSEDVTTNNETVPELSPAPVEKDTTRDDSNDEEEEEDRLRIDEPIEDVVEDTDEHIAEASVQVVNQILSETVESLEIAPTVEPPLESSSTTLEPRDSMLNKSPVCEEVPIYSPVSIKETIPEKLEPAKKNIGIRKPPQLSSKPIIVKTKRDVVPKTIATSQKTLEKPSPLEKIERIDLPTNLVISNETDDDEDTLRIDEPDETEEEPTTSAKSDEKMSKMIEGPPSSSINATELAEKLMEKTIKTSKPRIKTTAKHVELGLDISDSEDEDDNSQPVVTTTTKPNNQKRTTMLIDLPAPKSGRGIKRVNAEAIRLNATKRSKLSKSLDGSTMLRQALDLKLSVDELLRPLEERGFVLVNNQIPIECNAAVDVMIEFLKMNSVSDMWSVLLRHKQQGDSNRLVNTGEETFLNVSVSLIADHQMVLRLFIERVLSELASHDSSMSPMLCGCFTRLFCDAVRFVETEDEEEKSEWMSKFIHIMLLRHENQAIRMLAYCLVSSSVEYLQWISDEISNDTFFSKVLRIATWRDKQSAEVVNWLISAKLRNCPMIVDVEDKDVHDVTNRMFNEFLRLEIEQNEHQVANVRDTVVAFKTLTELIKTEHPVILQTTFEKIQGLMEELDNKLLGDEDGKKKPFMLFGQISDDKISASQASEMFLKFEWISKALHIFISNSNSKNRRAVMDCLVEISPKIVKFKQVLSSDSSQKVESSGHSLLLQAIQKMTSLIAEFTRYPLEKTVLPQNL